MSDNLFNYPAIIKKLRQAGNGYTKTEADAKFVKLEENNGFDKKIILGWSDQQKLVLEPVRERGDSKISNKVGSLLIESDLGEIRTRSQGSTIITTGPNGDIELNTRTLFLKPTNAISCNHKQIRDVADPTNDNHAATKRYVDTVKTLRTVDKANITLTRVRINSEQRNDAEFCKLALNNAEDKLFFKNALTAKKNVSLVFEIGTNVMTISGLQAFGAEKSSCIFHLPGF